jgi:hypothetical protein
LALVIGFAVTVSLNVGIRYASTGVLSLTSGSAPGIGMMLLTCQNNTLANDVDYGNETFAGNLGGFYFPDPNGVDRNRQEAFWFKAWNTMGLEKVLDCAINRFPGWIEAIEEETGDAFRDIGGPKWRPWIPLFTVLSLAGLIIARLRDPSMLWPMLGVVVALFVQSALGAWSSLRHISYVLPLMVIGICELGAFILGDLPNYLSRHKLPFSVYGVLSATPWIVVLFLSVMKTAGNRVDLFPVPQVPIESRISCDSIHLLDLSSRAQEVNRDLPSARIEKIWLTLGRDEGTTEVLKETKSSQQIALQIQMVVRKVPSEIWVEFHHADSPAVAQVRLPLRIQKQIVSATGGINISLCNASIQTTLFSHIQPGNYWVDVVEGSVRLSKLTSFTLQHSTPYTNLASGGTILVVPAPTWKDGNRKPVDLLAGDKTSVLGNVSTAVGWLHTPDVLVYVDLGKIKRIYSVVAHGSYGLWGIMPPERARIAVSDDGLGWHDLQDPALTFDLGSYSDSEAAFHIGLSDLNIQGRYVRIELSAPASSRSGFTIWGIKRVFPESLFLTSVQVFGE